VLGTVGLTLKPLTLDARDEHDIAEDVTGVLVADVDPAGSAAAKGIRPGDVIVEVGQEPVMTPVEVEARIREAVEKDKKSVLFLIQSRGDLRFVPLSVTG